jgi:hypothetical protein
MLLMETVYFDKIDHLSVAWFVFVVFLVINQFIYRKLVVGSRT